MLECMLNDIARTYVGTIDVSTIDGPVDASEQEFAVKLTRSLQEESGPAFAASLTRSLREAYGDLHFAVRYQPRHICKSRSAPPRFETDVRAGTFVVKFGTLYAGYEPYVEMFVEAMKYPRLTIDLTDSRGGEIDVAVLLLSFLTPPGTYLFTMTSRDTNVIARSSTRFDGVAMKLRYAGDVIIRCSSRTFSAAEAIIFVAKAHGIRVEGERTAGGANGIKYFTYGDYVLSIPAVHHHRDGDSWERVGVSP